MLRDRDAIVVSEGIIFRVYGYFHPPGGYVCDVEYAPSEIFVSDNLKAPRQAGSRVFYKFYSDEGLRFILCHYPKYTVHYRPLRRKIVGVYERYIKETRRPHLRLRKLLEEDPRDELLRALHRVIDMVTSRSGLSSRDFGVFGSLLHGFYHPRFSDIDLIIYGSRQLKRLLETLREIYREQDSPLRNEFETPEAAKKKSWRFLNYSIEEFLAHQRRKMIYAVFYDEEAGRQVKVEFEPVKEWSEIRNEYSDQMKITWKGWIRSVSKIRNSDEGPYMPSIYEIDLLETLKGPGVNDVRRIISFVEEFRMQAEEDEKVLVEGNLEEVETSNERFHQITLTYCPRYYEQVLKTLKN
jgi:predicted nucleotidyltransferase